MDRTRPSIGERALAFVVTLAWILSTSVVGCGDSGSGASSETLAPVADVDAASRAFQLFYAERVERATLAYNRFGLFGDTVAATTIGSRAIAKQGDEYEVIPRATDNNLIGTSALGAWNAYQVFRTRSLELTLIRMLDGLTFAESVTGIPGLTVREVMPGWTRVVDGRDGTVIRTRAGATVTHPDPPDPALEAEIIATFSDGLRFTYREDPTDVFFHFEPAAGIEDYAKTLSIDERPRFLRESDCCSSLMRTPEGNPWVDAWWGNHNSRDNFPDLGLGILTALDVAADPSVSVELRDAAVRAVAAGRRIGDLVEANGGNLMTVDEYHDYGDLTVGGARRPHGDPENQDLGSMAACPMAYLARAISSEGLDLPYPALPLPGEIEQLLLSDLLGVKIDLPVYDCLDLDQAYFGESFASIGQGEIFGLTLFELIRVLDALSPGLAETILGSFQNDYDDVVEATQAVYRYARITGRTALTESARAALLSQTRLQRTFADLLYGRSDPDRAASQRYDAALFEAGVGVETESTRGDLGDFATAEARISQIESELAIPDASPAALVSDAEIQGRIERNLAGEKLTSVVDRYRAAYGDTPPLRRTADGYEARTSVDPTYRTVEVPHHRFLGGAHFLEEIAVCVESPAILDCTWAKLGCAATDLDGNGVVDDTDRSLQASAASEATGRRCSAKNGWCNGADADHTGHVDDLDTAFLEAAQGCHYP